MCSSACRPRPFLLAGLLIAILWTGAPVRAAGPVEAPLSGAGIAMEGDVISLNGTMIRLAGIDAPDPGQTCRSRKGVEYDCFEAARLQLQSMLDLGEVECRLQQSDRGRPQRSGTCTVLGKDLAAAMIVRGWAFAFRRLNPEYASLEARAQARKAGLWAGPAEAPWLWRTRKLNEQ